MYVAFTVILLTIKREYKFDSTPEHRWKYHDIVPRRRKILYRSSSNCGSREIRVTYAKTKESCRTCTWHRDKSSPFNVRYMRGSYCRYAKCRCAPFSGYHKLKKVALRDARDWFFASALLQYLLDVIAILCMFNNIDKWRHNNITYINIEHICNGLCRAHKDLKMRLYRENMNFICAN